MGEIYGQNVYGHDFDQEEEKDELDEMLARIPETTSQSFGTLLTIVSPQE